MQVDPPVVANTVGGNYSLNGLCLGLHALRNFDDCLLPMVHQNWEALINRFSDDELEVRQEAIKVRYELTVVLCTVA